MEKIYLVLKTDSWHGNQVVAARKSKDDAILAIVENDTNVAVPTENQYGETEYVVVNKEAIDMLCDYNRTESDCHLCHCGELYNYAIQEVSLNGWED